MAFTNGYALVIAVASYPNIRRLPMTVIKDGEDIKMLLTDPAICGYLNHNVKLLCEDQASRANIIKQLEWLAQVASREDTVVIYFSGHGGRIEKGDFKGNYLLPYDTDTKRLKDTAIEGNDFTFLIGKIQSSRLLVLFDCCYSGGTGDLKSFSNLHPDFKFGLEENYYNLLGQGSGRVIIASSRSDEQSLVLPDMKNSLFTHYLLLALTGNAENRNDGLIRIFDIFHYLSEMVPSRDNRQHPILKGEMENNFPICLFMGGKKIITDETVDLGVLPKRTEENNRIYNDNRTGGVSFENSKVRITGDVIGGNQAKTDK